MCATVRMQITSGYILCSSIHHNLILFYSLPPSVYHQQYVRRKRVAFVYLKFLRLWIRFTPVTPRPAAGLDAVKQKVGKKFKNQQQSEIKSKDENISLLYLAVVDVVVSVGCGLCSSLHIFPRVVCIHTQHNIGPVVKIKDARHSHIGAEGMRQVDRG